MSKDTFEEFNIPVDLEVHWTEERRILKRPKCTGFAMMSQYRLEESQQDVDFL